MTDLVENASEAVSWQGKQAPDARQVDEPTAHGIKLHTAGRRLLGELLRPYRRPIIGVLLVVLLQVAATMAGPWLVGVAIDDSLPDAMHGDYRSMWLVGGGLLVAALLSGWLRSVFVVRSGVIGQRVLFDLRLRGYDHVQALSVSFHERFTSGRVISRLTSDVDTLTELLDSGLDGLLTAVFASTAIAVLLLVLDLPLGLIAVASLIPLWLLYRWFSPRAAVAFKRTREKVATMIVNIVETFNGIRAVQAFRREKRNDAIFAGLNDSYREANRDTFNLQAWFIPGTALVGNVATVVVLLVGGYRVSNGGLELGVLTSFLLYLRQFYDPMQDIGVFYNSLQSATAALEKIATVLAEPPSVAEPADPVPLGPVRGAVSLEQVSFAYRDDRIVLPSLSLDIPAGQTVALVGATGAGKTTIAKLISRFYDPTSGVVRLDGADLRDIADTDLRHAVVMITQDGFLFSGSVADNIGFGRLGATRDEIVAAAQAVGAHEFISQLPDGYDTDVPAERAVQRALRTVLAERTALIIAHRLSTVEIADRVLVLSEGVVIEDGTPEELVAEGDGQFASLHTAWRDSLA